jgi:hypothetical protein
MLPLVVPSGLWVEINLWRGSAVPERLRNCDLVATPSQPQDHLFPFARCSSVCLFSHILSSSHARIRLVKD